MTTLLVHDASPMSVALATELDVVALDGMTADAETVHVQCRASERVLIAFSGWDSATAQRETQQVDALIDALGGSGKQLVYLSDASVIGDTGSSFGNEDSQWSSRAPHVWRSQCEQRLERAIASGVHSVIVRLGLVHGRNAGTLVESLTSHAASTGQSLYVGEGTARVSTVHIDDVISLIRLALTVAPQGARYVAASDEIVSWRDVALSIAADGGATAVSVSAATAVAAGLDGATMAIANVMRDRSAHRRSGWSASGRGFLDALVAAPDV